MKNKRKIKYDLLILEIIMIIIAVVYIFPALLIVMNSLKTDAQINLNPVSLPTSFNIGNFIIAWQTIHFPKALLNTFIITLLSTIGIILVGSMAAYVMVRIKSRLSWITYLIFTFSILVPFQTFMVPLVMLSKDLHLQSIAGIVPIYWGLGCPIAVFMFHGFIKGVPIELEEAATIDGANIFHIFFKIVFPLLTPIVATIAILDVLWIWNDFLLPLIVLPKQSTLQLAQYGFFSQFRREYGPATASLVLSSVPVVAFYLAMQRYIVKGIMAGAVKG